MKNYSKYKNKKTKLDGYNFDSKKEAHYYLQYKILARAGKTEDLKLQPSFELQIKFRDKDGVSHRAITYKGDFSFIENGKKSSSRCEALIKTSNAGISDQKEIVNV